jgi:hypothetical protein
MLDPKNITVRNELKLVLEQSKLHPEEDVMKTKFASIFNTSGGIYK